jgi:hypothetical protein
MQLNGPASFRSMPHDIDHAGAYFAHRDANLPEPNFIAINSENGPGIPACFWQCRLLGTPRQGSNLSIFTAQSSVALPSASAPTATTPG